MYFIVLYTFNGDMTCGADYFINEVLKQATQLNMTVEEIDLRYFTGVPKNISIKFQLAGNIQPVSSVPGENYKFLTSWRVFEYKK